MHSLRINLIIFIQSVADYLYFDNNCLYSNYSSVKVDLLDCLNRLLLMPPFNWKVEYSVQFGGKKRLLFILCVRKRVFRRLYNFKIVSFPILHQLAKIGTVFTSVIIPMTSSAKPCLKTPCKYIYRLQSKTCIVF